VYEQQPLILCDSTNGRSDFKLYHGLRASGCTVQGDRRGWYGVALKCTLQADRTGMDGNQILFWKPLNKAVKAKPHQGICLDGRLQVWNSTVERWLVCRNTQ